MKFTTFKNLIDRINTDLADFKGKFAYKRKELAELKKAPNRDVFFKYTNSDRDWAINEGGGTEIQYHLFYRDNTIGYGLGFNAQYVPFANNMSSVDYIKPFVSAYLNLLKQNNSIIIKLKNKGFSFIYGEEKDLVSIQNNDYYLFGKEIKIDSSNNIPDNDYNQMIDYLQNDIYNLYIAIWEEKIKATKTDENMVNALNLLTANHNLILTGAPGTGKTYLAKQMAQQMILKTIKEKLNDKDKEYLLKEHCGFVQFHPSYDYTDFVEGLRPVQDDKDDNKNAGFERKDGVFKEFCKKAIEKNDSKAFDDAYDKLLIDIGEGQLHLKTKNGNQFAVSINSKSNLKLLTGTELKENGVLTRDRIKAEFKGENPYQYWKGYYRGVVEHLIKKYNIKIEGKKYINSPYVFIIDEINRGEISKIFGELFFSIDPGYRGEKELVQTQYQNIVEDGDIFKKGFFVPENVYIIGTMNDIDRSVESMDFAFRRRFAFKEITAEKSQAMLDSEDAWGKDENGKSLKPDDKIVGDIKEKMNNLNKAIWHKPIDGESDEDKSIEGLSSAYHIGASYFLKVTNYKNDDDSFDFDKLWEYHLEGLLFEYLRGTTEMAKKLKKLAEAYGYTKADKYE